MRELEVKLLVDPGVELPPTEELLAGCGSWTVEEIDQQAVYFDTADLRLTRSGVSLRYRSDDGWTVKLPEARDDATFLRQEYGFVGEFGDPPRAAVEFVRAWVRTEPLGEVCTISTRRRKISVFDDHGNPACEIDDDDVTASVPGGAPQQFREIEVETHEGGDPQLAPTLVERLRKAGAGTGDSLPKVARALGERGIATPDLVTPTRLARTATLAELVRASITGSVQLLLDNDHVVQTGEDPEGVHQARVATRRLRSNLRTLRPILDRGWSDPLRAELQWLGDQLGHVRDADVLLGRLRSKAQELPADRQVPAHALVDRLQVMRDRDQAVLLDAMRSPRYTLLLEQLVEGARSPRMGTTRGAARASKSAAGLARRPWKRLRTTVKQLPGDPTNLALHEVRKRAKQARYALEAIAPVVGGTARRTAGRLADLQDILGDQHDAIVAIAWLHDTAMDTGDPEQAFVAGEIAGSFAADARALQGRWQPAWKRVKRTA